MNNFRHSRYLYYRHDTHNENHSNDSRYINNTNHSHYIYDYDYKSNVNDSNDKSIFMI